MTKKTKRMLIILDYELISFFIFIASFLPFISGFATLNFSKLNIYHSLGVFIYLFYIIATYKLAKTSFKLNECISKLKELDVTEEEIFQISSKFNCILSWYISDYFISRIQLFIFYKLKILNINDDVLEKYFPKIGRDDLISKDQNNILTEFFNKNMKLNILRVEYIKIVNFFQYILYGLIFSWLFLINFDTDFEIGIVEALILFCTYFLTLRIFSKIELDITNRVYREFVEFFNNKDLGIKLPKD